MNQIGRMGAENVDPENPISFPVGNDRDQSLTIPRGLSLPQSALAKASDLDRLLRIPAGCDTAVIGLRFRQPDSSNFINVKMPVGMTS
jgi:hypothetical protein